MPRLRLALAQTNPIVGDLPGNADQILAAAELAYQGGADLLAVGEMALSGYPIDFGGGPVTGDGYYNVFIAKYSAAGGHVWSRTYGAGVTGNSNGIAIAADASVTPTGLASKVITPGRGGAKPVAASTVKVHYTGWTTDGQMFDNSYSRGETTKFPLGGVIKGWTEGLQLMTVGERTRFWIPAELAYGNDGPPGAPKASPGTIATFA